MEGHAGGAHHRAHGLVCSPVGEPEQASPCAQPGFCSCGALACWGRVVAASGLPSTGRGVRPWACARAATSRQDHDIGAVLAHGLQGGLAALTPRHDVDVGDLLDEGLQSLAHNWGVISFSDDEANGHRALQTAYAVR